MLSHLVCRNLCVGSHSIEHANHNFLAATIYANLLHIIGRLFVGLRPTTIANRNRKPLPPNFDKRRSANPILFRVRRNLSNRSGLYCILGRGAGFILLHYNSPCSPLGCMCITATVGFDLAVRIPTHNKRLASAVLPRPTNACRAGEHPAAVGTGAAHPHGQTCRSVWQGNRFSAASGPVPKAA